MSPLNSIAHVRAARQACLALGRLLWYDEVEGWQMIEGW
jgi:hypothetical protein